MFFSKVVSIFSLAAAASAVSGMSCRQPPMSRNPPPQKNKAINLTCKQKVSYDTGYDDASRSLSSVSCSDGTNGLLTKGYTNQGSLPDFPYIGGADVVASWNDADVSLLVGSSCTSHRVSHPGEEIKPRY